MVLKEIVLSLVSLVFIIDSVVCTEVIPVYFWSSKRSTDKIPALRKVSQDSFKDDILEQLKYHDLIVAFAEQTLSPEDFVQRDETGEKVFSHLDKIRQSSKIGYLPYVQSPIKALKNIDAPVTELFVDNLKNNFNLPETDILIVNLNDAEESESRNEMLKRHDKLIASIYKKFEKSGKSVLALFTAYHESWMTSEEVTNSRRVRSLLATATGADTPRTFYNDSNILVYFTSAIYKESKNNVINITNINISSSKKSNGTAVKLESTNPQLEMTIEFTNTSSLGYWELSGISANVKGEEQKVYSSASMYAPYGFSYHCGDQDFYSQNFSLMIKDFQIQVYESSPPASNKFDDAYDCVGFTTVPIWSGLFVTVILLLILTFGITMMMDIRTMDRFDDPKGKTITISAE